MAFLVAIRSLATRLKLWAQDHRGEVLWAALFALVFGVPAAIYFAYYVTELPPYKIYIVAGSHYLNKSTNSDRDTESQFKSSAELVGLNIDDVPVRVEVQELEDDRPETAKTKAQELAAKNDTLLVIGDLDSEPTEMSLPTYFKARPQVPFIASIQTDDNLLSKSLLVKDCEGPEGATCYDGLNALPYLQLSPTNEEQAHWAVQFATESSRHHFLVVESDTSNAPYSKSLAEDYQKAIDELINRDPNATKHFLHEDDLTRAKLREDLRDDDIDCLLYAGGLDDAPPLLKKIADILKDGKKGEKETDAAITVLLGDSVVEQRLDGTKFDLTSVNITDQADAEDYKRGLSVYGLDAIAIAAQLINDMNTRGLDFNYRVKALFRQQKAVDVRRNLVRTMQDNIKYRSSYLGAAKTAISPSSRTVYAFNQHARSNGMFHVWQRTEHQTADVDRWHPPKTASSTAVSRNSNVNVSASNSRLKP
jgi:hypothetical protein